MSGDEPHIKFAVLATDVVLFRIYEGRLQVLMIPVNRPPHFVDMIGMPGGLIAPEETAKEAAIRIVENKTGVQTKNLYIEQLYTFSDVDRDPRNRVVAVAYIALMRSDSDVALTGGAQWVDIASVDSLAYDHNKMLDVAVERLQSKVLYTNVIQYLLPKQFTLTELQDAYELVTGSEFDKRNFRKKILATDIVSPTGQKKASGAHRPAELYTFASADVQVVPLFG